MDQIRDIYNKSVRIVNDKPQKITQQICTRVLALINTEEDNMEANNDYSNIQELIIIREKFESISQAFSQITNKQHLYLRIKNILKANSSTPVQATIKQTQKQYPQTVEAPHRGLQKQQDLNYFDFKKKQIQKSQLGFSSVLGNTPKLNKKYESKPPKGQISKDKTGKIQHDQKKELRQQIDSLKNKLNSKNEQDRKYEHIHKQKIHLENQINHLQKKIKQVKHQNNYLKAQIQLKHEKPNQHPLQKIGQSFDQSQIKNNQIYSHHNYQPQQIFKMEKSMFQPQSHLPKQIQTKNQNNYLPLNKKYQINYQSNDIGKLKEQISNSLPIKQYQPYKEIKNQPTQLKIQNVQSTIHKMNIKSFTKPNLYKTQIKDNIYQKQQQGKQILQNSFLFKASQHKFNKSQVYDQAKNIAIRSKISFFKPSMIIYRGKKFQVAVKAIEQERLVSKKIVVYINNKQQTKNQVIINYKFNPNYYKVKLIKKASFVDPYCQEKQELQVKLISSDNFDSIIEVQLTVNTKTIHFLLPTMFIDFIQKRPHLSKKVHYQKQKVNPMHQFSNVYLAQEIIPLEIIYGQLYQTGRVYAITRYCQGYIYFRWIEGKLQVQTIPPLKLFIAYLLLKDC